MVVRCESFGFRYGLPPDANLVFDLRFLPNPHFVPELRALPGDHPEVRAWLEARARGGGDVHADSATCVEALLPAYKREQKSYLVVAFGCTGGKHRSVYFAERLRAAPAGQGLGGGAGPPRPRPRGLAGVRGARHATQAGRVSGVAPCGCGASPGIIPRMVGVLIISHGRLATELLAAARTIEPALTEQSRAITLEWNLDPEAGRAEIARALKELDTGDGVIVLTDMFGGTPTNLSLGFLDPARSEVVTGVNLPMLIKLASVTPAGRPRPAPARQGRRREGPEEHLRGERDPRASAGRWRDGQWLSSRLNSSTGSASTPAPPPSSCTPPPASPRRCWSATTTRRSTGSRSSGLLLLAAPCGSSLTITAIGDDETRRLDAIEALIKDRFGEGE